MENVPMRPAQSNGNMHLSWKSDKITLKFHMWKCKDFQWGLGLDPKPLFYNLSQINLGIVVLEYASAGKEKYSKSADLIL